MEFVVFLITILVLLIHVVILQFNVWLKRQSQNRLFTATLSFVSHAMNQISKLLGGETSGRNAESTRGGRPSAPNETKSRNDDSPYVPR